MACVVQPGSSGFQKVFFGNEEIAIPVASRSVLALCHVSFSDGDVQTHSGFHVQGLIFWLLYLQRHGRGQGASEGRRLHQLCVHAQVRCDLISVHTPTTLPHHNVPVARPHPLYFCSH